MPAGRQVVDAGAGDAECERNDALWYIHKTIDDISQRMLTVTLRTLEADGLVERKAYAEVPPRVEYCLTEMGHSLIPHVEALVGWALDHMTMIFEHREQQKGL